MKDYFMGMIAGIIFGMLLIAIVRHFLQPTRTKK